MDINENNNTITNPKLVKMMELAEKFHGHRCPGLAIGVVASKIALENAKPAKNEEFVAIVENDACGVDGIQALTGCTFGKGNLIFHDYGKSVYTFFNRGDGTALRLVLKPETFSTKQGSRQRELFELVRNQSATKDEIEEYNELRNQRIESILLKGEDLFEIQRLTITPPDKARIFKSINCDHCGELVMETRVHEKNGKKLCIPCFEKSKDE